MASTASSATRIGFWFSGLTDRYYACIVSSNITRLYGIDGCRAGWVAAVADPELQNLQIHLISNLEALFARAGLDSLVAIDIPIGLPETEARACDTTARMLLRSPRSSSVFSPPSRRTLPAETFREALQLNREALGIGISKQAFHIMRKIDEVDRLMTADRQRYVREVHPEVTFAQLNGGPLQHAKKQAEGREKRIALLRKAGLQVSEASLVEERSKLGASAVFLDDLVDALACLVTAADIHRGRSCSLGAARQRDARGLAMEIVTVYSAGYTAGYV
jgi:predicted RNase H-like nuclease